MVNNQARSENLRVQELIQDSSPAKAGMGCIFMNGDKELGTLLEMPHPCSLSLTYEQAKLKESNGELVVTLNIEEECKALSVVVPKWMQAVQDNGEGDHQAKEVTAKWWFHSRFHILTISQDVRSHYSPTHASITVENIRVDSISS